MDTSAFICEAIAGVIYLVVGVRLLLLGLRTHQAPEYFIALAFLCWALGYALYDIPYLFAEGDQSPAPFYAYTSLLCFNLGNLALALFTREVFRKKQPWAGWLVVAIAISLVFGAAGSAWVGDWAQLDPVANPGYWPQTVGALIPAVWMGVEGLAHYARAHKRLGVGLCSPLTCHHFLLWGLAGALWSGLEIVVVMQDFIYLSAGDWSAALGVLNGLLEFVAVAMIWLAFCTPAFYSRWVEGSAKPADATQPTLD